MDASEKQEIISVLRSKIEKQRASIDGALLKIVDLGVPITIFVKGQIALNPEPRFEHFFPWFALCWIITLVAVIVSHKFSEMGYKKTVFNVRHNIEKGGPIME